MKHSIVLLPAVAAAAVLLAACGSTSSSATSGTPEGASQDASTSAEPEASSEEVSGFIQLIQPGVHPYPAAQNEAAKARAAELGVDLQITQSNWDAAEDLANVQDAISKGAKAIIIQPNSSESITSAIDQANAAGICTIALLTNPGGSVDTVYDGMKGYIGWNEFESGKALGEAIAKKLNGSGNVVVIQGALASNAAKAREQGALEAWKAYPDIKVLASQPADYDSDKARKVMTDYLQKYGDQINAVMSITDNMATAAADAIAASDQAGKIRVASIGGQGQLIDYIKEGKVFANVPFMPADEGRTAVDLAVDCMKGDRTPVFVDERTFPDLASLEPAGYVVTADNAESFTPQW